MTLFDRAVTPGKKKKIISVTSALYWQLTWFRCRCWRERNWWGWLLSIKTQIICSRVLLSNCRWNSLFNMMNPKKQSHTMINFSDTCGQDHFISGDANAFHLSGEEPSCVLQKTGSSPPAEEAQGRAGPPRRAPTAPQALGVKLVGVTKQPVLIKPFRQVLPSCKRSRNCVWGGCIMPLLQLCDKPRWSCHGSCKCVYT